MVTRYLYAFLILPLLWPGLSGCDRTRTSALPDLQAVAERKPVEASPTARYAKGFSVKRRGSFHLLSVYHAGQGRTDTLRYLLAPRGRELSFDTSGVQVIRTPVERVVVTSATHVGMIDALDRAGSIVGVTDPRYLYHPGVHRRIDRGEVTVLRGGSPSMERILAMEPDLLMVSGGQVGRFEEYRLLLRSGINVVVNSEWLERSPLARAEWIKVAGLLYERGDEAANNFRETERRYRELARMADRAETRPTVINNLPYKGAWFVSGGDSYVAGFLRDAGASYPWLNTESTGSLKLDFEAVYEKGLEADVWLTPGTATSRADILQKDSRLGDFRAYRTGRIYNNTRRTNERGGNDYWESGVVNPHVILADLIAILHPGMLPDRRLYYYEKVE